MKNLFFKVMIFSLLVSVVGCSNGLVSDSEKELSGGDLPTQETKPETISGQNEPENINTDDTGGQEQNENEPPEVVTPEIEQNETEKPEVEKPEENQSENETPEVKPPIIEPPIVEPSEEEPPETEPPEMLPPIEPPITPPNNAMLLINELKTEFSSSSKHAEYIEFKVTNAGNLNGISVHIMYNANNPFVYNFPDVNVGKGEYITLHLRTIENNCVNELEDNLSLSGGTDSCPTSRDLWVAGSEKHLHKTDIVYLKDASGKIIDSIVMNEKPSLTWNKSQSHFQVIVENLCNVGAWESEDGEKPTAFDAVNTSSIGSSYIKSVCRYEWRQNHFNTTDWYINPTSSTPGLPNQ